PGYLLIAHDESDPYTETALFSMHCFWEGEARLAAIPGVVATRAGFVKSAEVVEATFLPLVVSRDDLTERARQAGCNPVPGTRFRPAPAHDQQHALLGTPYEKLQLTAMQRAKLHSAPTLGGDPMTSLTPRATRPRRVAQVAAVFQNP
ncbi:MAG: hypothetical protein ACREYC_06660, partial [Gammaproteobacteria bacterium]